MAAPIDNARASKYIHCRSIMSNLQTISLIIGVVSGIAGLLFGLAGLVLGILNFWHQRVTTRPRITIRPCFYNIHERNTNAKNVPVIQISNVGQIPVHGSMISFLPKWDLFHTFTNHLPIPLAKLASKLMKGHPQNKGFFLVNPTALDNQEWPRELMPQNVAIIGFDLDTDFPTTNELGRACVTTTVGDRFKATRRDMRIFSEQRKLVERGEATN